MREKHKRRSCLPFLIFVLLVYLTYNGTIPRAAGRFLVVNEPIKNADLIYVFAGGTVERPGYAAELFKKGYAPTVIVAGVLIDFNFVAMDLYFNDGILNRKMLVRHGVPGKNIVQIWDGTSTYEEVVALKKYMVEHKSKKAILVTSAFHTRRVRMCVNRVFKDVDAELMVVAVPDPYHNVDNWWKEENSMIAVFTEYVKMAYYFVKYRD